MGLSDVQDGAQLALLGKWQFMDVRKPVNGGVVAHEFRFVEF